MVGIPALWLPILLSAIVVFLVSSVLHMVLSYHRRDYQKLPNEDRLMEALRNDGVTPGNYMFPCPTDPKEMRSAEMMEKWTKGPVGLLNVLPSGPPTMGKQLTLWIVYTLVIGIFVAYVTGRTQGAGAEYLAVFRVAGVAALLGYAGGHAQDSIWKGQAWGTTGRHVFDGLIYALLTAGIFGWLWP